MSIGKSNSYFEAISYRQAGLDCSAAMNNAAPSPVLGMEFHDRRCCRYSPSDAGSGHQQTFQTLRELRLVLPGALLNPTKFIALHPRYSALPSLKLYILLPKFLISFVKDLI
jgi:hypothetical protein